MYTSLLESGWRSGHQSRLPPLRPGIESARGLRFVDLNLTPRVFLRVLQISSLCKFDFHAKIWAVERLNINLWLGRMSNHFLRNWRKIKYLFIYLFYLWQIFSIGTLLLFMLVSLTIH